MERYNSIFEEQLTGKLNLKFKGEDEIGKFWVVIKSTEFSELEDILFEADIFDMYLQIKGGLNPQDIIGLYKNKNKAKNKAIELLKN